MNSTSGLGKTYIIENYFFALFCTFNEVLLENSIKQHRLDIKDLNIMANRIKLFRTDYLEQEDCLRGSHILYSKFPPKIIF
jgi:hypothetical protein